MNPETAQKEQKKDLERYDVIRDWIAKWDPVGFYNLPGAEWKELAYNQCAGGVLRLLKNGTTENEIFEFLKKQCRQEMGLNCHVETTQETAKNIFQWWNTKP